MELKPCPFCGGEGRQARQLLELIVAGRAALKETD